jgi:hypothetical protein
MPHRRGRWSPTKAICLISEAVSIEGGGIRSSGVAGVQELQNVEKSDFDEWIA